MKWYSNLYVSENIDEKAEKIKWKINHNAGTVNMYVIALPSNSANLLDMISTYSLLQKRYPKKNLRIVGLAKGYDEGLELIRQIVDETYKNTGGFNIREYLDNREREDK